jgi:predicted transcriptional regulator
LVNTDDELLLEQVHALLEGNAIEVWDELNPKLKDALNRGLEQSKKGKGTPHDEVMKEIRARLK